MKLLSYRVGESTRAARVEGDTAVELPFVDVGAILAAGALETAKNLDGRRHPVSDLNLAQPVGAPPKIVCVGQNYRGHIREQGGEIPQYPTLFVKWPRTLIGPHDDIELPEVSECADWEVELAFYVGHSLRHANEDEASRAIAGYTVLNDISIRDWQWHTSQFLPGKNFEATTPVGPWMVTPDEINPLQLTLRCSVDGAVMQESSTTDFVFTPGQIASYVSTFTTLEPGDLIATGTPAGVGAFRKPPIYLKHGNVVTCEIVGIGELVNRCIRN